MTAAGAGDRRIPVTLLTGFLGAGKTTLLNHLLRQPQAAGSAVLVNELGTVGVDLHLLDPRLLEKVDETLVVLDSGCICCSVQGDLVRALKGLFMRALRREIPAPRRVLVETTGLADPAPVIHTLMAEPFIAGRYRCDGVIAAVDATHALQQLGAHREAVRQVAMADRLLITKCDLADDAGREALKRRLAGLNPAAAQIEVRMGEAGADAFFGCGLYDPAGKVPDVTAWLGEEAVQARQAAHAAPQWRRPGTGARHAAADAAPEAAARRHDEGVASFVLRFDAPLPWFEFSDALGLLLQLHGNRILRIKGLLDVAGDPLPRVVQCVQHTVYPPASLPAWPDQPPFGDHRSRLVFIVRDLPREAVEAMFAAFVGRAAS